MSPPRRRAGGRADIVVAPAISEKQLAEMLPRLNRAMRPKICGVAGASRLKGGLMPTLVHQRIGALAGYVSAFPIDGFFAIGAALVLPQAVFRLRWRMGFRRVRTSAERASRPAYTEFR